MLDDAGCELYGCELAMEMMKVKKEDLIPRDADRPVFRFAPMVVLMATLAVAVGGLDNLDAIIPAVRDLGSRHVGYGVEAAHYETVGTALIWTLEQGLGDDFTEQTKEAWVAAYGLLTSVMIEAGEGSAA